MKIEPFGVEMWMNAHETTCTFNLAETCVAAMSLADLFTLIGQADGPWAGLETMPMTYGDIFGSPRLRQAIAALYALRGPEDVIVTHGTIGANDLAWRALVGPGDHVVSFVPTYQQHVSIPRSLGAEVTELPLTEGQNWLPDLTALRAALRSDTKVVAFTNPNNPTGALMPPETLRAVVTVAEAVGVTVLADEVYRGTAQVGSGWTESAADLSDRVVVTSGMSKAFSLAGLRLGWVTGPADVLARVASHRDYTTISVGRLDDHLAALALERSDAILARSCAITRRHLAILADWVNAEPRVTWVKPRAGTTALLRYDAAVGSEAFCRDLLAQTGVLLVPGAVMGMEGHVRLGFANTQADLREGLPRISAFLATLPRKSDTTAQASGASTL
ncbi:MAG: aminotransferase class I/II-fold pyridoxal phosphate-dependent enzyme [Pseudomonadota bacterium]